jgi:hypothetical protein
MNDVRIGRAKVYDANVQVFIIPSSLADAGFTGKLQMSSGTGTLT